MREIDQKLFDAVWNGDYAAVREALDQGADPNARDGEGDTPLHAAIWYGFTKIADLLRKRSAVE